MVQVAVFRSSRARAHGWSINNQAVNFGKDLRASDLRALWSLVKVVREMHLKSDKMPLHCESIISRLS